MSGRLVRQDFAHNGGSTAVPANVSYRLNKLDELRLLRGRWLDCGCSDGGYTAGLAARTRAATFGVDPDLAVLAPAHDATRLEAYVGGFSEALPFAADLFDGVLVNEVLEHVTDERAALAEVYRVLRPGGTLALFSPNRYFPFEGHGMVLFSWTLLVPVPLLPWLPSALTNRVMRARNYWPSELSSEVAAAGFHVELVTAAWPVFEVYRWLPAWLVAGYRRMLPAIEHIPLVRRFGVSTLVVGRKPVLR